MRQRNERGHGPKKNVRIFLTCYSNIFPTEHDRIAGLCGNSIAISIGLRGGITAQIEAIQISVSWFFDDHWNPIFALICAAGCRPVFALYFPYSGVIAWDFEIAFRSEARGLP
jgi:hypothetical protein